jgi:hypothetical protein
VLYPVLLFFLYDNWCCRRGKLILLLFEASGLLWYSLWLYQPINLTRMSASAVFVSCDCYVLCR